MADENNSLESWYKFLDNSLWENVKKTSTKNTSEQIEDDYEYSNEELFGIVQGTPTEQVSDPKAVLIDNDKDSMLNHNVQYDNLLEGYVKNANNMFVIKMVCKIIMFVTSIFLMLVVFAIAIIIPIISILGFIPEDNIVPVVSLLTTFLSTFIVIPKIMRKYLFNENEESNMAQIIGNIQTHDKAIRDGINHEEKTN